MFERSIAERAAKQCHHPVDGCEQPVLHLHRLDHEQRLSLGHGREARRSASPCPGEHHALVVHLDNPAAKVPTPRLGQMMRARDLDRHRAFRIGTGTKPGQRRPGIVPAFGSGSEPMVWTWLLP